jgi:hypothetical protein
LKCSSTTGIGIVARIENGNEIRVWNSASGGAQLAI